MANRITIKVVSQIVNLRFTGTAIRKNSAAASRMNALLNVKTDSQSVKESPRQQSSKSFTIYENKLTTDKPSDVGPVSFEFDQALGYFDQLNDAKASNARRSFFTQVELGKKELFEKYGSRIPNEELLELSKKLSRVACTIWKHQIVTTRTDENQFTGARRNRDGSWTSTVKSRTIYTLAPIPDVQLECLQQIVVGQKSGTILATRKQVNTVRGYRNAFVSENGNIILKESSDLSRSG